MEMPTEKLKLRTYNVAAMSFTPEQLVAAVRKHVPNLEVSYRPDGRQDIGKALEGKFVPLFWSEKPRLPLSFSPLIKATPRPSSIYSAFHSRSPTRAVTGPEEIHAFSPWN
jgi:hypothetical protein